MITTLVLALALIGSGPVPATRELAGTWKGGVQLGRSVVRLTATLSARNGIVSATVTTSAGDSTPTRLEGIELHGTRFRAVLHRDGAPIRLEGTTGVGRIEGRCEAGHERGSFELVRPVPLDSAGMARCAGVYRLGPSQLLEIMPSDAGDGTLFFSEPSGRAGPLVSFSPSGFVAGPNLRDVFPVERRAEFQTNRRGEVVAVVWGGDRGPGRRAPRVRSATEEIVFESEDARISGTLTRPCGIGPWPAIVLVHGSGRATRDQFGTLPRVCAALGIACLAFDKRGCGRSTGRYHDLLPVDQLATDVMAAIRSLSGRSDLDSNRVGLWGASQGGWVVARISERWHPAFIVLQSAPTLSVAENGLFEIDNELRSAGFGEADVSEARRLNRLFHRMILSGGVGWDSLRTEIAEWRRARWFAQAGLPDSLPETPAPANLRWVERLRRYLEYDPIPAWRRVEAPVLAFYGGRDRNVPGEQSATALRSALAEAGNRGATVVLDPEADHWLWRIPASGRPEERSNKIERMGERFAEWLVARARPPATRPCPD